MSNPAHERARGWAVVAILFLSMGSTIGAAQYSFGLFVPPIESAFSWSRTQISASLSFVAVGSLVAPLLGRLMDRLGARPILVFSLALTALSYLLRPLMTELWHWYALSLVQFVAYAGSTTLPTARLVAIWFGDRRGRVMGLASAGPNFGGLVLPVMVAWLLATSSWQVAYGALGCILLVLAVAAWFVIREQPQHSARAKRSGNPQATLDPTKGMTVREALHSRAFYSITIVTVLAMFTYSTVLPHVIVHMTNEGLSARRAVLVLGVMAMFGMVGKLAFGYISERISTRNGFIVDLLGMSMFIVLLASCTPAAFIWLVPMYGFFHGGIGVLMLLIMQEYFGLKHFGAISGLSSMATVLPFSVGPIIAGLSYDWTGSYTASFVSVAAMFVVGAGVLMMTRPATRQS